MAKGLRSKAKRTNRSRMREVVVKPIIEKQQEKANKAMAKHIQLQTGESLMSLKSKLIKKNRKTDSNDMENDNEEVEIEESDSESESSVPKRTTVPKANEKYVPKQRLPSKDFAWYEKH